ncbi:hypothetical protein SAMN05216387_10125 [Nitrosovibrio tenuis]|uniref:Uncharacterized protein n=1 Tax=Nitrosovibrio tenuis TaxID=1233 RepID=A0A1H7FLA4_9PROT|nr:hypothetical protein SAMN05216387_10125 [Nitrosovibrio tenuis]
MLLSNGVCRVKQKPDVMISDMSGKDDGPQLICEVGSLHMYTS